LQGYPCDYWISVGDLDLVKTIFVVSDSTGLTAETVLNSVILQFGNIDFEIIRISRVGKTSKIIELVQEASEKKGLIVYTIVSEELRNVLVSESKRHGIFSIDLIGPLLDELSVFFGKKPRFFPGIQHELSAGYFRGIECVEYTINHDDGRDPEGLYRADLILIGVSRTSKTPLSIFLSNQYSLCVANIPIVLGVDLPKEIFNINRNRVIGLHISPDRLMEIRSARMQRISNISESEYADLTQVQKELEYGYHLFVENGWRIIDITFKSIEEAATEIMDLMEKTGSIKKTEE
jgi:regulator of PEP synthase PpsR (kinase-PPPase family)